MLSFTYNNDSVTLNGEFSKNTLDIITEECSYSVPNAEWSVKYQKGTWDGKISLFNKRSNSFPSGLLSMICKKLDDQNIKYEIIDERNIPFKTKLAQVDLGEHKFRDYQEQAIQKIKESERGILAITTGGGKTKTACGIISELSVYPVIFIVPSVSLLKQTVTEFKNSLKPLHKTFEIGEIGGGVCKMAESGVNVATYHTLLSSFDKKYSESKKKVIDLDFDKVTLPSLQRQLKNHQLDLQHSPESKKKTILKKILELEKKIEKKLTIIEDKKKIRDLILNCQLLISDETHIASETIEFISLKATRAYYKVGLSATPFRNDNQDKRMFGASGPIIHKVSASDLIKRGFLVKPFIYGIDLDMLDKTSTTYQETYKNAIVLSPERNQLISQIANKMHDLNRPTLIFVERIEHGKLLESMIENCVFVPGKDGSDDSPVSDQELDYRRQQLNKLEKNEIVMVATQWINQGVDAPKISCLILAGSTASDNTTIQQIGRGLRKAEGKSDCLIFDFKMKEKHLKNHFYSRQKVYRSEEEFEYKLLKFNSVKNLFV